MLLPKQAPGLDRSRINCNKSFIKEGIVAQQFSATYFGPVHVDLERQRLREYIESFVNWELIRTVLEHHCDEKEKICIDSCGSSPYVNNELDYRICRAGCALKRRNCLY